MKGREYMPKKIAVLMGGPGSERDKVRCFSMMHAPSATAATGTATPIVWSESPAGTSKRRANSGIVRRFISSAAAGYALVHLSSASCDSIWRTAPSKREKR